MVGPVPVAELVDKAGAPSTQPCTNSPKLISASASTARPSAPLRRPGGEGCRGKSPASVPVPRPGQQIQVRRVPEGTTPRVRTSSALKCAQIRRCDSPASRNAIARAISSVGSCAGRSPRNRACPVSCTSPPAASCASTRRRSRRKPTSTANTCCAAAIRHCRPRTPPSATSSCSRSNAAGGHEAGSRPAPGLPPARGTHPRPRSALPARLASDPCRRNPLRRNLGHHVSRARPPPPRHLHRPHRHQRGHPCPRRSEHKSRLQTGGITRNAGSGAAVIPERHGSDTGSSKNATGIVSCRKQRSWRIGGSRFSSVAGGS